MNIEKQLETAVKTNHLVLVVFYADWSPHYEWIGTSAYVPYVSAPLY